MCVSPRARRNKGHFKNRNKTRMTGVEKTRGECLTMKLERMKGVRSYLPW